MKNWKLVSQRLGWAINSKLAANPELRKITQASVAKVAGVSPTAAGYWFADKNGMNAEQARLVAEFLAVDAVWLEKGTGEPIAADARFDKNVSPVTMGKRAIPVISAIQAGAMREISSPYEPGDGSATIFVDDSYSKWVFALEIEGNSMTPDYQPGDIVIIEPEWEPRPGDCVVAKNGHEEATFKKYRQRGTDAAGNAIFELIPLNEDYPTVRSDETPLFIIGVMAEFRRKVKRR